MAQVDFGPLGAVDFPDEWTDEQLDAHIKQNGAAILKDLIAKNQELNRQEAEQSAGPDTIPEAVGSAVGSMAQGAANTIGSTLRVGGRFVNLGAGYYEPAGADTDPRLQSVEADLSAAGGESPVDRLHRINSGPIVEAGNKIEDKVEASVPTLPQSRDSFWFGDVPQGIGNAGFMVAVGALLGPTAGVLTGFGAESDDAFQEEIARQQKDGETPDVNKAMAKSLGYGTAAAAIEAKLGAGRIIRKLRASFGGKTAEETAFNAVKNGVSGSWLGHMLKNSVKEGVAGYSEEALQRLSEDLIVNGTPNFEGMHREGAAGGVVQAILGIPGSHLEYRKHGPLNPRKVMSEATAKQAENADMPKTANAVADMELATEQLYNPDLQMEDVADVVATTEPGQNITQAQTDAVFIAAEQARQAAVKAEQEKNATPPEPTPSESVTAPDAPVEEPQPTTPNEQPTEVTTTEPTVNPEPRVGEGNAQSVVPVPATVSDNGSEPVPVVEPSTTPETITGTPEASQPGSTEASGVAPSEASKENVAPEVATEPDKSLGVPESTPVPTVADVKEVPDQITSDADRTEANSLASNPSQLQSLATYQIRGGGSAQTHLNVLESAVGRGEPVNASLVLDHGKPVPSGYTQRGALLFPSQKQDKILAALDKAIEATSTKRKVFDVVSGVSHVVANTILKAVRAAYVGGKALTAAIRDAIAEYKKSNPTEAFDEEGLSDWLSNQALGSTANPESRVEPSITMDGERQQSEAVSWLKDPEYSYRKETEKGRLEAANKIIEIYGDDLQGALNFVRRAGEGSGLTASIAEVTAAQIANKAQEKAFAAKNVIDRRAAEALRDAAIVTAKGGLSSQGQGLQAGKQVGEVLGAGAAVAQYQQMVQTKLDKFFKNKFPGVVSTKIKDWLHTAGQQAVQEMKDAMAQADNVVARVMKQARADYGTTWSEIMQDSAKAQDGHRKEIFRRILSHPKLQGLSRAEALEIANLLGKAWEKQRLAIFRREFAKVIKLPNVAEADMVKLKASIPKFIQQINLGLWDNEAFRNAIAPQFGQNPVSEDASRSIYKAAQEAQDAPEGPQRQTKIRRVAQLIAKESGVPIGEIIRGWWYASVLSGIGTQGRNFLGNTSQLVDNFVAFSVRQPDAIPRLISGLLRGMAQNASGEFGSILLRGQEASGRMAEDIRKPSSAAETMSQDKRLWAKVFSNSKYVGRLMSAVDSFFYASNAEMMANFMAFRKGKMEGASTREEMNQYISEALKVDPNSKEWMDAQAQAEKEAAAGLLADKHIGTINRRRIQILNESRPLDIQQDTHRYALEATLNNEPEGVLGAVASSLIQLRSKYPALTPIIPFVRISANVTNMLLDHSPAGVVKLLLARPEGFQLPIIGDSLRYPKRHLTEEQFRQLTAKVVVSSIVMMGLAIKAAMDLDDDKPDFQITGSMDSLTTAKRKQLEEEGIRPYQIRVGGVGLDYRQTPGALMLSMLGSWLDGVRYSKFDEKEESVKLAALMAAGHGVIVDQSFLSGLQGILDRGPNAGSGDKWARSLANAIGGVIPRMAKDIDRMVNPTVAQAKGFWDNLLKETPVARWSLATQKNILGEDIQRPAYPWSWAGSANNTDPVWKALNDKAQQGVFLPAVSASARVLQNGTRVKMTDDQFERYQVETGKQYRKALEKDLGRIEQMTPQEFDQWIKTTLTPIRERVRSQIR